MYKKLCIVGVLLQGMLFVSDGTLYDDIQGVTFVERKFQSETLHRHDLVEQKSWRIPLHVQQNLTATQYVKLFIDNGGQLNQVPRERIVACLATSEDVEFLLSIGAEFFQSDIEYASTDKVVCVISQLLFLERN